MKRKIFKCYYCKWSWMSNKKPKRCPKCHNPVGKKPKYKTRVNYK